MVYDIISLLTTAYDEGALRTEDHPPPGTEGFDELTNDELLMFCALLVVAGNETTRNAISGGLRAFSDFPEERAKLRADPSPIDSAVEEILRFVSPVLSLVRGLATELETAVDRWLGQLFPELPEDHRVQSSVITTHVLDSFLEEPIFADPARALRRAAAVATLIFPD